jgi:hypothetical protein
VRPSDRYPGGAVSSINLGFHILALRPLAGISENSFPVPVIRGKISIDRQDRKLEPKRPLVLIAVLREVGDVG